MLAAPPWDERDWAPVLDYARKKLLTEGSSRQVIVVGEVAAPVVAGLFDLQSEGRARVALEADPWRLVERELAGDRRPITPIWCAKLSGLGIATWAASVLSSSDRAVVPTADGGHLGLLLRTGRVRDAVSYGGSMPDVGDVPTPSIATFHEWKDIVGWTLAGGPAGQGGPATPPAGTDYTLAFYTGVAYKDRAFDPNYSGPNKCRKVPFCGAGAPCPATKCTETQLSFYDSTDVAVELCRNRAKCIPFGLVADAGVVPCFNPYKQDPSLDEGWCQYPNDPVKESVEELSDMVVAGAVQYFKQFGVEFTKLAVVSHPMDIPYRRFIFPLRFCNGTVLQLVDNVMKTDNTEPRDGDCTSGPPDASGHIDGSTGATDFYLADIDPLQPGVPPRADLAFARVGSDTKPFAMAHVANVRARVGPAPTLSPPSGVYNVGSPGKGLEAIFTGAYTVPSPPISGACNGEQIPPGETGESRPFCPTNSKTVSSNGNLYACYEMTYVHDDDLWVHASRSGKNAENRELISVAGHQDPTPESYPAHYLDPNNPAHDYLWPFDRLRVQTGKHPVKPPYGPCPNPGPLPNGTANPYNKTPDDAAPYLGSEQLRREQTKCPADGPDLAPGFWFLGGSNMASFNYRSHPQNVRVCALGPDSSWLSTLIPGGIAALVMHMELTPIPGRQCTGFNVGLLYRELALGESLGTGVRRVANYASSLCGASSPYHMDQMVFGEPDLKLNLQGAPSQDTIAFLSAPGPGTVNECDPNRHPSKARVKGYNRDGVFFGLPDFYAYGTADYGCNVASGNIDGGATDEILTGAGYGPGYASHVRGFNWDGSPIPSVSFFAQFSGGSGFGVSVSPYRFEDDAIDEILVAPGPGVSFGPQIRAYRPNGAAIPEVNFNAFGLGLYGANIARRDVPSTHDQIFAGRGWDPSFGPQAALFDVDPATGGVTQVDKNFVADLPPSYGANVASGDIDGNGVHDLVLGAGGGPQNATSIAVLSGDSPTPISSHIALGGRFNALSPGGYGARVATADLTPDLTGRTDEILVTRGPDPRNADPACPAMIENSAIKGFDYAPGTPTGLEEVLHFFNYVPGVFDTSGGSSISGASLAVPRVPAAPLPQPIDILRAIHRIIRVADDAVFADQTSRDALSAQCRVCASLLSRDLSAALVEIAELRQDVEDEVVDDFVQTELTASTDQLTQEVVLQMTDLPPAASIDGRTNVCPGLPFAYSAEGSTDADDRGLSRSDIQTYSWKLDGQPVPGNEAFTDIAMPSYGGHTVEVTVTDTFGLSDTAALFVQAEDGEAPRATLTLTPSTLWPPNHEMVPIAAALDIRDNCDQAPTFKLVSVTSNEPPRGCGSGDLWPDVEGAEVGTPDVEFSVRRERCGTGNGRLYTATYDVKDAAGNVTRISGTVTVPHDKGQ